MMKINIAIDGPAGSGKSSAGYELAKKLNYQFIDTGLTYRAFTYFCVKVGVDFTNHHQLQAQLANFKYQVINNHVYVNNEDITYKLQTNLVLDNINKITGLDFIRAAMVCLQRKLVVKKGNVVVGRDITTVVLPDAEVKIYLTASITARANRRWNQNQENNIVPNNLAEIKVKLKERDYVDTTRAVGPLKIAPDAVVVDSSKLTFEQTVTKIYQVICNYKKAGK
ncbi:(d)CMP kinase [Spiroplasma citri]|nr:(d)CMP kinase [Spiroplasma citri]